MFPWIGAGADGGRGLEVRVGIESGEAAIGEGPAGQLLVTGTVVNAAARLQTGYRFEQWYDLGHVARSHGDLSAHEVFLSVEVGY